MQLKNIECQIANAQIGRFLAGDPMSDEMIQQLEAHISKCGECKQSLAERRSLLQAMLAPNESEVSAVPTGREATTGVAAFIRSRLKSKDTVRAVTTQAPTKTSMAKPMIYSVSLGVVLVGMSYASKNMGGLLGPKAADDAPVVATSSAPVNPIQQPISDPAPTVATPPPVPDEVTAAASTVSSAMNFAVHHALATPAESSNNGEISRTSSHPRRHDEEDSSSSEIRIYAPQK